MMVSDLKGGRYRRGYDVRSSGNISSLITYARYAFRIPTSASSGFQRSAQPQTALYLYPRSNPLAEVIHPSVDIAEQTGMRPYGRRGATGRPLCFKDHDTLDHFKCYRAYPKTPGLLGVFTMTNNPRFPSCVQHGELIVRLECE